MATCVEKLPHLCGTSDGLQVWYSETSDTYTGYCFACSTYVGNPYEDGAKKPPIKLRKTKEQIEEELAEIDGYRTVDLPERKLKQYALDYFGIKIGLSEQDGKTPTLHYYPYYSAGDRKGYKVRVIDNKQMWVVGSIEGTDMFGWRQALDSGARTLYITEGELDAVTVYQVIKDGERNPAYKDYHPAVVSLSNGASGAEKEISNHYKNITRSFKEVVLVFDNDKPGQAAMHKVMQLLPDARAASLPEKDPNDCLIKGRAKALRNAVLFNNSTPKNSRILTVDDVLEEALSTPQMGVEWPWQGLTDMTRGVRPGETVYIGAGVKMGKSTVLDILATHLMVDKQMKVFMAKPEELPGYTAKLLAGKVMGKIFHDPSIPYEEDDLIQGLDTIREQVRFLENYQHLGWKTLRPDIMEAAEDGCQAVFIDPITNLTNGVPAAEANVVLQEIAQDLAAIAKDKELMIFIFCHLRAPELGAPHERGGQVMSHQFAGSRAMMRSCNLMLGLEGNKDPNLEPIQRNVRKLVVLEDRQFGSSGYINLFYDEKTGLMNEMPVYE